MPYLDISGKNIYYELYGESNNHALVYFHGGPGASCLDFAEQAKELGRRWKVILFDQCGVLRSDPILKEEAYGMDIQAAMIEDMRKKLHISSWSVLGHSYGGMLACLYTHAYPSSVDKLILDCPSLNFTDSAKSVARHMSEYVSKSGNNEAKALLKKIKTTEYTDTTVIVDLLALLGHIHDRQLRNYLHGISYEEYAKCAACAETLSTEMWTRSETHLRKLIEEGKIIENFLPMLKEIHHPILLIHGRYDPACSANQIGYIREHIKNARQISFKNSGHFPRIEEPAQYTQCVNDFLSEP